MLIKMEILESIKYVISQLILGTFCEFQNKIKTSTLVVGLQNVNLCVILHSLLDVIDAFDEALMLQTINDIKAGKSVTLPQYDYVKNCGSVVSRWYLLIIAMRIIGFH